jgi:endonuclease/exonuclease/phosphatase family metal-dependent hydrolase
MPPFPKPDTDFEYDLDIELTRLREHRRLREIPDRGDGRLLLATWNVANLGVQERRQQDYGLIAELIDWFDVVALQEVADDLTGLYAIRDLLPDRRILVSDTAGNDERAAFVYDPEKVELRELVGRLSVPPSDFRHVRLEGVEGEFRGFDRSPYLAAFRAGSFTFLLVNVHLFFGSDDPNDVARRALETYAVARWADLRQTSDHAYTKDIVALGDFNLPVVEEGDPIFEALTSRGLVLPPHLSNVGGSSIFGSKHYDQIAIFPGETSELSELIDTFDFDNALFRELWDPDDPAAFLAYTRYYLSDHRPLWAEFRL